MTCATQEDLEIEMAYLSRFLRPGGVFGIVIPGLIREFPDDSVPEHLADFWDPRECFSFHTVDWWHRHLARSEILDVDTADVLDGGCREWAEFIAAQVAAGAATREGTASEGKQVAADDGRYLGFIRAAGRRREADCRTST